MQVGDVVRFDRTWGVDHPENPLWAVVTDCKNDGFFCDQLIRGGWGGSVEDIHSIDKQNGEGACWIIVPVEEWPEEICIIMAKRGLLGDAND